jgi:hypothetical protein
MKFIKALNFKKTLRKNLSFKGLLDFWVWKVPQKSLKIVRKKSFKLYVCIELKDTSVTEEKLSKLINIWLEQINQLLKFWINDSLNWKHADSL